MLRDSLGATGPADAAGFSSGHLLVKGNDLEHARAAVSGVFVDHRLRAAQAQAERPVKVAYRKFQALSVCYFDYGREVDISPDLLDGFYLVQMPLSGASTVRSGGQTASCWAGKAAVLPALEEFRITWGGEARKILIQVDRHALVSKCEAYLGRALTRAPSFRLDAQDFLHVGSPMRNALEGLIGLATAPPVAGQAQIASAFEEAFLMAMLFTAENDLSPALRAGALSSACPVAVRRAEAYIDAHLTESICIEDLVAASGVSARSLFEGFRQFRDMSPMRFVKFRRLHRARERLSEPGEETCVSSVATECGFAHFGRFAADYARLFGEAPSATLQEARRRLS